MNEWNICVLCHKEFYYDRRIQKCARCCREQREGRA